MICGRGKMLQSILQMKILTIQLSSSVFPNPVIDLCNLFNLTESLGTTAPIIQLSDISFSYEKGGKPIFSHVTLDVDMNSRICLLGPNGVGKSTLLSVLFES